MLHSNKNYTVQVNEDTTGYDIRNKSTHVVEYETTMLPDAMKIADMLNHHLENMSKNEDEPMIKAINFSEMLN
jgi:hypothetical protein